MQQFRAKRRFISQSQTSVRKNGPKMTCVVVRVTFTMAHGAQLWKKKSKNWRQRWTWTGQWSAEMLSLATRLKEQRKSATVNINHVCRSHRVTSALKKEKTTISATARARFIMEHGVQSKWILIRKWKRRKWLDKSSARTANLEILLSVLTRNVTASTKTHRFWMKRSSSTGKWISTTKCTRLNWRQKTTV